MRAQTHWALGAPGEGVDPLAAGDTRWGVDPVHQAHPLNTEGLTVHSGFTSSVAENNLGTEKGKSPPLSPSTKAWPTHAGHGLGF